MHLRVLLAAGLLAGLALGVSAPMSDSTARLPPVERAMERHVQGLEALTQGRHVEGRQLLESACQDRHEASCQAVWLQLDLSSPDEDLTARWDLEITARKLADATGGTWFSTPPEDGWSVRVYCPTERESDLRGALESLSIRPGAE